jgi:uncharacterized protein YndB with AHSA1/START domain
MNDLKVSEARTVQYEFAISIASTKEHVWRVLTEQVASWWLPDFHMLGTDSIVSLEPRAGGRLFEKIGDKELLWYSVFSIMPEASLDLIGYCSADYGGPSTSLLTLKLAGDGKSTTLHVRDSLFGHVPDSHALSLQSGWKQLFTLGLKAYCEQ